MNFYGREEDLETYLSICHSIKKIRIQYFCIRLLKIHFNISLPLIQSLILYKEPHVTAWKTKKVMRKNNSPLPTWNAIQNYRPNLQLIEQRRDSGSISFPALANKNGQISTLQGMYLLIIPLCIFCSSHTQVPFQALEIQHKGAPQQELETCNAHW